MTEPEAPRVPDGRVALSGDAELRCRSGGTARARAAPHGARSLEWPRDRERRRLSIPAHPCARRSDSAALELRGGESPLLRATHHAERRRAARRGVRARARAAAAIARVARLAYNEPYWAVPMRSTVPRAPVEDPGRVSYEWRTGSRWQHVAATASGPARAAERSVRGDVHHRALLGLHAPARRRDGRVRGGAPALARVGRQSSPSLDADVPRLYGSSFARALVGQPASAFIAEGSPVTVYRPQLLVATSGERFALSARHAAPCRALVMHEVRRALNSSCSTARSHRLVAALRAFLPSPRSPMVTR